MVLEANLQAKALVLMEQLQKNLKVLDEASFAPQALAEMQFVGSLSNVQGTYSLLLPNYCANFGPSV